MNRAETIAFNAGVQTVLDHARRIALALDAKRSALIAEGFASEGLNALADEGRSLLLPIPALPNGGTS